MAQSKSAPGAEPGADFKGTCRNPNTADAEDDFFTLLEKSGLKTPGPQRRTATGEGGHFHERLRRLGMWPSPSAAPREVLRPAEITGREQERVWAYIEGIARKQAGLTKGSRNDEQNQGAYKAFRLAQGVGIPLERVAELLYEANVANGQVADDGEKQVHDTMASARQAAERDGPEYLKPGDGVVAPPAFVIDATEADDFFESRESLRHIRDFARARRRSPWAVLGATLVRVIGIVPPSVVIPGSLAGGQMSLNLQVALVGPSGSGKGASEACSREAVTLAAEPPEFTVGSGEGIARALMDLADETGYVSAIFTAAEVDTLAALFERSGATLAGELRKMFSGERLGFSNAAKATRTQVLAHSYRAGLLIGVQPLRAKVLLDAADGGTPQRLVWLPVLDPDMPVTRPAEPPPVHIEAPTFAPSRDGLTADASITELTIPRVARDAIDAHQLAMHRGEVDPLDGHALLVQLKVAVALMILDGKGRTTPNDEDWRLAGIIMDASRRCREAVQQQTAARASATNRARAYAAAERELTIAERVERSERERCQRAILSKLRRSGRVKRRGLQQTVTQKLRGHLDSVLESLVASGDVVEHPGVDGGAPEYEIGDKG